MKKVFLITVLCLMFYNCASPTKPVDECIVLEDPDPMIKTHSFYDEALYILKYKSNSEMPIMKDTVIGDKAGVWIVGDLTLSGIKDYENLCRWYFSDGGFKIYNDAWFIFNYDSVIRVKETFTCWDNTLDSPVIEFRSTLDYVWAWALTRTSNMKRRAMPCEKIKATHLRNF